MKRLESGENHVPYSIVWATRHGGVAFDAAFDECLDITIGISGRHRVLALVDPSERRAWRSRIARLDPYNILEVPRFVGETVALLHTLMVLRGRGISTRIAWVPLGGVHAVGPIFEAALRRALEMSAREDRRVIFLAGSDEDPDQSSPRWLVPLAQTPDRAFVGTLVPREHATQLGDMALRISSIMVGNPEAVLAFLARARPDLVELFTDGPMSSMLRTNPGLLDLLPRCSIVPDLLERSGREHAKFVSV